jgi:hypothetical protein
MFTHDCKNGVRLHTNSDLSGDAIISGRDGQEVQIAWADIRAIIDEYERHQEAQDREVFLRGYFERHPVKQ